MIRVRLRRLRRAQLVYIAALTVIWVLLWGDLSVGNVLSGGLIAALVVVVLPMPPIPFAGRIRLGGLVKLTAKFLLDVVVASVQVAIQVFDFRRQPRSAIVKLNMRSDSDLYLTITAEMTSLVPGTLAIELQRPNSMMLVHVLLGHNDDLDARIADIRAQEDRVLAAFASDEELARAYPFTKLAGSQGGRP